MNVQGENYSNKVVTLLLRQYFFVGAFFILFGYLLNFYAKNHLSPASDSFQFFTELHGTIIVFFGIVPVLFIGLGYFLLAPLDTNGASSRWLSWAGLGLFYLSAILLFISLLVQEKPFWIIALIPNLACGLVCSWIFIVTTIRNRLAGVRWLQMRSVIWTLFATALFIFPEFLLLGLAAFIQLRSYLASGSLDSQPLVGVSETPVLWKHFFWFMGHPEVFVILFPILGLTMDGIRAVFRKIRLAA